MIGLVKLYLLLYANTIPIHQCGKIAESIPVIFYSFALADWSYQHRYIRAETITYQGLSSKLRDNVFMLFKY